MTEACALKQVVLKSSSLRRPGLDRTCSIGDTVCQPSVSKRLLQGGATRTASMKKRRFSKRATVLAVIVIVALVIFLALLSWFAFTAFLPSATNPWQAMRGDSLG